MDKEKNNYENVLAFALSKHVGQKRRDGVTAYITHLIAVSEMLRQAGFDEKYVLAALLHDTLEDTDTSVDELNSLVTEDIVEAVQLLTRKKGEDEEIYLKAILSNEIASVVKSADKVHNLWECVRNGAAGEKMSESAYHFAVRYVKKTRRYYRNKLSRAVDRELQRAEKALRKRVFLPVNGLPVMRKLDYIPYSARHDITLVWSQEEYEKLPQPDLDGTDVKFYQVRLSLFLDENSSLGFTAGKRPMWVMSPIGWRPVKEDLLSFYEDVFIIDREEAAEMIEDLRKEGEIKPFVKRRLI